MIDLSRCPRTRRALEAIGLPSDGHELVLEPHWQEQTVLYRRGHRREQRERVDHLRALGANRTEALLPFLGWVLLEDSWRHVRTAAIEELLRFPAPAASALVALGLADRSKLVVRAAQAGLRVPGRAAAFPILIALWEDRATTPEALLDALIFMAEQAPHPTMRTVVPRLEREAKRWFLSGSYRERLRAATLRIDQATRHLKDLPLTAHADPAWANLPLPAQPGDDPTNPPQRLWARLWNRLRRRSS